MSQDDLQSALWKAQSEQSRALARVPSHLTGGSATSSHQFIVKDHYGRGPYEAYLTAVVTTGRAAERLLLRMRLEGEGRKQADDAKREASEKDEKSGAVSGVAYVPANDAGSPKKVKF